MCAEWGRSWQQAAAASYSGHCPSCPVLLPLIFGFWLENREAEVLPPNGRSLEELSAVVMEPHLPLMLWEAEAGQDTEGKRCCAMRKATLGH